MVVRMEVLLLVLLPLMGEVEDGDEGLKAKRKEVRGVRR